MPTHEHIIGELYLQLAAAHDEIDQLHAACADEMRRRYAAEEQIRGYQADIAGMTNPLAYAYACEACDFETDEEWKMSEHVLRVHDACDPHGIERVTVPEVW